MANEFVLPANTNLVASYFRLRPDVQTHSIRVAAFMMTLIDEAARQNVYQGDELYSDRIISRIPRSARLHDVGKLGIEEKILYKPGRLTDVEYKRIQQHVNIADLSIRITANEISHYGPTQLEETSISIGVLHSIVCDHHERWDGFGYPKHKQGSEIALLSRICSLADTFDAMVVDRPYRRGMPWRDAWAEVWRCSGTQLDPQVCSVFLSRDDAFKHIYELSPEQLIDRYHLEFEE